MRHLLLLTSPFGLACAAIVAATPAPALAFEPSADLGYAFELQQWTATGSGGTAAFNGLMHTVTMSDRTGLVMALVTSAARTEGNRQAAERDAIARREAFYTYQQHIDEPKDGVRLGLVLGTGSPNGLYAPGLTQPPADTGAKMARLNIEGDLTELPLGTLGFHTGLNWLQATATGYELTSWGLPLGVAWRLAPLPIRGLVFEPFADFDWGQAFGKRLAGDVGVRASWYLHPAFALQGRLELAKWGIDGGSFSKGDLADVRTASLGGILLF